MPVPPDYLGPDEEVLVDLRPHWVFLSGPLALTVAAFVASLAIAAELAHPPGAVVLVLVLMVAVPTAWLATRVAAWLAISLVLTGNRLILRHGVLRKEVVQLRLSRITEVRCTQTVVERMVGSGRLEVDLEGEEEPVVIDDVRRPRSLQRVLISRLDRWDGGGVVDPPDPRVAPGDPTPLDHQVAPGDPTPPHGVPASPTPTPTPTPTPAPAPAAAGEVAASGQPESADAPVRVSGAGEWASITERLVQLDDLRRRGILTQSEFEEKKAELLSRL